MKRKHLILLPAFAAALAAWVGAGYYLHRMGTFRACLTLLDLILLAHLLLARLDILRERLQAWPAGEKRLRLHRRSRKERAGMEAEIEEPASVREEQRRPWQPPEEPTTPKYDPPPVQQDHPAEQPQARPARDPSGWYAELIEPERLQLGLLPRLRPSQQRTALQIVAGKGVYGLVVAEHWLGQQRRGSDLINQHLPALFHMGQLTPGALYRIRREGMRPAMLAPTPDGKLEVTEKGSLIVDRC